MFYTVRSRLITIGELSACFAHEVTNPLMLIRGHVRFVEESLPADHPLRINFEVIERASRMPKETVSSSWVWRAGWIIADFVVAVAGRPVSSIEAHHGKLPTQVRIDK